MAVTLDAAVSAFGAALKAKLSNPAIKGAPEDQLRAPLEKLIADLAEASGLLAGAVGDRRPSSELDKIQPADCTSHLHRPSNVLGRIVKLEPAQADPLGRICAGRLASAAALLKAGAIVPKPGSDAA